MVRNRGTAAERLEECRVQGHRWPPVRQAMTDRQFATTRSRCARCHARRTAVLRTDLDTPTIEVSFHYRDVTVSHLEDLVVPRPSSPDELLAREDALQQALERELAALTEEQQSRHG
jgi:hypothetical protein